MASVYYGVDKGGSVQTDVTRDTSTTSKVIELVVDDSLSILEVLEGIEAQKAFLVSRTRL